MSAQVNTKPLLTLSLAFILFTVVGTISHELSHLVTAQYLGYETTLHYGSVSYESSDLSNKLLEIYMINQEAIEKGLDFDKKEAYEAGVIQIHKENLLITSSGSLQTILTGMIGLTILFWRREKFNTQQLSIIDWTAIFLSLFWLREVFNVITAFGHEIIVPNGSYFSGDEREVSTLLNLWPGTISLILGAIGLIISIYIVFWVVPKASRLTFILSGLIGGTLGFALWMHVLGPIVLP